MPRSHQLGDVVLDYELVEVVGYGGQSDVYKACHVQTGALKAFKVLSADPGDTDFDEHVERLQREGNLRFGHPNIIEPIDCVEEDDDWYLIMPFVEGTDLEVFVRSCGGRCSPDQAVDIMGALADGLAAVHDRGIVHRDIKPANIMVKPDGRPVLLDFGIARNVHENTISGSGHLGTPGYMSPEQTQDGRCVDYRSDLFSLGLVQRFMLTGIHPVQASDPDAAMKIIREQPFPRLSQIDPSIPPELDAICDQLLAKRPEDRYPGARELGAALAQSRGSRAGCCPRCRCAIPCRSSFCPSCGASLSGNGDVVRCLACGGCAGTCAVCAQCNRPFGPTNHRLIFTGGTVAGVTFRIPEGIFEVGRATISPWDASISRTHVRVACLNGTAVFQDAGSTNTTMIGSQPALAPVQLQPNQTILIGGNLGTYLN